MTAFWAILAAAGIIAFWLTLPYVSTKIGNLGRERMDRTLWKSLPDAEPCPCGSPWHLTGSQKHGGER